MVHQKGAALKSRALEFHCRFSKLCVVPISTQNLTWHQLYVGLVSYGIGHSNGVAIANWRLLFIVLGSISLLFALAMWFLFPDRPESGRFLSEREAVIAVERKRADNTGIENKVGHHDIMQNDIGADEFCRLGSGASFVKH